MKLSLVNNISDEKFDILRNVIFKISSQYCISYILSADFKRELSVWYEIDMLRKSYYEN